MLFGIYSLRESAAAGCRNCEGFGILVKDTTAGWRPQAAEGQSPAAQEAGDSDL